MGDEHASFGRMQTVHNITQLLTKIFRMKSPIGENEDGIVRGKEFFEINFLESGSLNGIPIRITEAQFYNESERINEIPRSRTSKEIRQPVVIRNVVKPC